MARIFLGDRVIHEGASGVYRAEPSAGEGASCLITATYCAVFLFALFGLCTIAANYGEIIAAIRAFMAAWGF